MREQRTDHNPRLLEYKLDAHNPQVIERFILTYPSATIALIEPREIPSEAMLHFENKSRGLILSKEYFPGNFGGFFMVHYAEGDVAYVSHQPKVYESGTIEKLTYVFETDSIHNIKKGHGEIRLDVTSKTSFFMNKPFVGFTDTSEDFQRQGLGLRRLNLMNALSYAFHQLPLHSSTIFCSVSAQSCWELLRERGHARKYLECNKVRYAFCNAPAFSKRSNPCIDAIASLQ